MKIFAGAALCLVLTLPAAAQDKPAATGANDPSDKEVLELCRAVALAKGGDSDARRQAIVTCIVDARPKITSRFHCLMDPKLKTLDKAARLIAMENCVRGKR
jgi:hypothetical protein